MYITVNGVRLYYEKSGSGAPLIMVHCNSMNHKIFNRAVKVLSDHFTVYCPDSRDHGKSQKVKTLHYEDMAEDMYQFIQKLHLGKPAFYGFSDGGIIGLMLILRHPDCLSVLAISGTNLSPEGLIPSFVEEYTAINEKEPDPLITLMLTEPHIDPETLKDISVPVLVTAGENDLILQSETEKIAGLIPNAKLQILKDHDHGSYIAGSKIMGELLIDFLKKHY